MRAQRPGHHRRLRLEFAAVERPAGEFRTVLEERIRHMFAHQAEGNGDRSAEQLVVGPEGGALGEALGQAGEERSEEHTSELRSLMRISYAGFCLKKKRKNRTNRQYTQVSMT